MSTKSPRKIPMMRYKYIRPQKSGVGCQHLRISVRTSSHNRFHSKVTDPSLQLFTSWGREGVWEFASASNQVSSPRNNTHPSFSCHVSEWHQCGRFDGIDVMDTVNNEAENRCKVWVMKVWVNCQHPVRFILDSHCCSVTDVQKIDMIYSSVEWVTFFLCSLPSCPKHMYHACRTHKRRMGPTQISFDATHIVILLSSTSPSFPDKSYGTEIHSKQGVVCPRFRFDLKTKGKLARDVQDTLESSPWTHANQLFSDKKCWRFGRDWNNHLRTPWLHYLHGKDFCPPSLLALSDLNDGAQTLAHAWMDHAQGKDPLLHTVQAAANISLLSFRQSKSESDRILYPFCWHLSALYRFIYPSMSADCGAEMFMTMSRIRKTKKRFKRSRLTLSVALCSTATTTNMIIHSRHIYTFRCKERRNRRETTSAFGGCATADTAMLSSLPSPPFLLPIGLDQTQEKSTVVYHLSISWPCMHWVLFSPIGLWTQCTNARKMLSWQHSNRSLLTRRITKTMLRCLTRIKQRYQRRDKRGEP